MTGMNLSSITAHDVNVTLGGRTIIEGASLTAPAGEITAIVGPNGSGKTTFLRAICGDVDYSGEVWLNNQKLSTLKAWQTASMRAVLPQSTSLSFPYTVREIVKLGLLNGRSGARASDIERLPELALERVDLEGFAGRFYQELSGGEQQRVQLARILCQVWAPVLDGAPRYLLLDEPVSSLDIRHQLVIMKIAQDFAAAGGGVIAILHDLNLTAMFADSIVVMQNGRVAASGAPGEVLQDDLIAGVFGCALRVGMAPPRGMPFVLPQSVLSA